jgi:perosamine synthetase
MLALGLKPGEEVITTSFSFVASTSCILYEGGVPRFVDIDAASWNLDPDLLERALTPRTKGILPVHVFGTPCAMEEIVGFARSHGLWVVEDACEAIGARYGEHLAGTQAEISVLAFYPNKQITTGEGGVLLTDDEQCAALCRSLRNQGRSEGGGWLAHERLGFNYRLSDMAAALGTSQLRRLDEILEKRAAVASRYMQRLKACPHLRFQQTPPRAHKSWFVFVVALSEDFGRRERDRLLSELRARDIGCSNYFPPIHLQPFMNGRLAMGTGHLPVCEALAARTVALPFHSNLTADEVDAVCDACLEILETLAPEAKRTAAEPGARSDS